MKRFVFYFVLLGICMLSGLAGCTEQVLMETDFVSSDLPNNNATVISYNGGIYRLNFKTEKVTKSQDTVYIACQYRINYGDVIGKAVPVRPGTTSVDVEITPNYSADRRKVTVQTAEMREGAEWTTVIESRQESALMKVSGFYWAKGNVTLKNGRFGIADSMTDPGLFFKAGSKYGLLPERTYGGKAYAPEPVEISLADLLTENGETDVCTQIDPGLRSPSYMEFYYLFADEDLSKDECNGVGGIGYKNSPFFMPFSGSISLETGEWTGAGEYSGFNGIGCNYNGDGVVYSMNKSYSLVDYNLAGTSLASLRCVRNTRLPSYVSHSPETTVDCRAFEMTVRTEPGEFELYEILWEASDGTVLMEDATNEVTEQKFTIPMNESLSDRTWKLFINRIDSGVSFVQPKLSSYVRYRSHSPKEAEYGAFTLTVTCESDLDVFPVTIKGSDGFEMTENGSKDKLSLTFDIPENVGEKRTLAIWIKGVDTGITVVQEEAPRQSGFSVVWSEGYLTVKDSKFVFAAPDEKGMYFKWKSRYGIAYEGGSTVYPGKVYGPELKEIAFADIPLGDTDPCALVAPAGTWFMPEPEMMLELAEAPVKTLEKTEGHVAWIVSDGGQTVRLEAAGTANPTSGKQGMVSSVLIWTSVSLETGRASNLMWLTTDDTKTGKIAERTKDGTGMMVRCVRKK